MSESEESAKDKSQTRAAVFIDRDGTLNEDIGYVSRPEELVLYPCAAEAVRQLNEAGFLAVVITNQSGIARGLYTEKSLAAIHSRMIEELDRQGAQIDAVYYCPHHPEIGSHHYRQHCDCRKPQPGLLKLAAREHNIDLTRSFVIGDKASDIKLAENAGARAALVLTGYGRETLKHPERWPCTPEIVAENVLEAARRILDIVSAQS
jgi:D-glycero-D-manno-heptose 1,7-bisphosphate phosphatase